MGYFKKCYLFTRVKVVTFHSRGWVMKSIWEFYKLFKTKLIIAILSTASFPYRKKINIVFSPSSPQYLQYNRKENCLSSPVSCLF